MFREKFQIWISCELNVSVLGFRAVSETEEVCAETGAQLWHQPQPSFSERVSAAAGEAWHVHKLTCHGLTREHRCDAFHANSDLYKLTWFWFLPQLLSWLADSGLTDVKVSWRWTRLPVVTSWAGQMYKQTTRRWICCFSLKNKKLSKGLRCVSHLRCPPA